MYNYRYHSYRILYSSNLAVILQKLRIRPRVTHVVDTRPLNITMSLYTSNWNFLGHQPFRKYEIFSMSWGSEYSIDLREYNVSAADFGGPIGWY